MDIGRLPPVTGIGERPTSGQPRNTPPDTTERSLVPVAGRPIESRQAPSTRPSPAFLAQLIATAQHAPQTRARGRAEPADAIGTYNGGSSICAPARSWERS